MGFFVGINIFRILGQLPTNEYVPSLPMYKTKYIWQLPAPNLYYLLPHSMSTTLHNIENPAAPMLNTNPSSLSKPLTPPDPPDPPAFARGSGAVVVGRGEGIVPVGAPSSVRV